MASAILKDGYLEYDGTWVPVRRYGEVSVGIEETRRLANYLLKCCDEIEKNKEMFFPKFSAAQKKEFEKELIDSYGWIDEDINLLK